MYTELCIFPFASGSIVAQQGTNPWTPFTSLPRDRDRIKPLDLIIISRYQWHRNTLHKHHKDELNWIWAVTNSRIKILVCYI